MTKYERRPKEEYRTFSIRLKRALDRKGIRAIKLAEDLNIGRNSVSQYLNRLSMPERSRLEEIAEYLNVAPTWLMGMDVNTDGTAIDPVEQSRNRMYLLNAIQTATEEQLDKIAQIYDLIKDEDEHT